MQEMLGNQYFLARNYALARQALEAALIHCPHNISIKKKLIICHIQTNSIQRALDIFSEVIQQDIFAIINTDPVFENCPCPQLVMEMENTFDLVGDRDRNLALGMLWLYCELEQSLWYFLQVSNPDSTIQTIIARLQSTIHLLQPRRTT